MFMVTDFLFLGALLANSEKNSAGYKTGLTAVAAVGSLCIPEDQQLAS